MKTVNLLILLLLFLLYGCSLDDKSKYNVVPGNENEEYYKAQCHVIKLKPTGGDDTQLLKDAFSNAQQSGPGTTIQLAEGTFTIGMIEVRDFDGYLTGAGKGKTIIANASDLPCDELILENVVPALLTFVGGNVVVSEMTFQTKDGRPCRASSVNDAAYGDLPSMVVFSDYSALYVPGERQINGVLCNVDFIAGPDGGYGTYGTPGNTAMLFYGGGDLWSTADFMPVSRGNILIRNCTFRNGLTGPDLWGFDEKSRINVEGCNFESGWLAQLYTGSFMGAQVSFKNNRCSGSTYTDFFIWGGDFGYWPNVMPLKPTRYAISGNYFNTTAGAISIYAVDAFRSTYPEPVQPQLFDISSNIFKTGKGDIPAINYYGAREKAKAIQTINAKDALIYNNTFLGSAEIGILVDGDETTNTWAENARIFDNRFLTAKYDATLYLGPLSKNCKFVGAKSDLVVDDGVNNQIIGTRSFHKFFQFSKSIRAYDEKSYLRRNLK